MKPSMENNYEGNELTRDIRKNNKVSKKHGQVSGLIERSY